ncbi:MAG: cysteine desulfurase [Anaerolineales bacterium]|jgi:cysteine desulfurase/selenocysteine lyase
MGNPPEINTLDVDRVRAAFPVLKREVYPGIPLVYLDSAATSQKPQPVIDAVVGYYEQHNANIHRGIHRLAEESTVAYEAARQRVADMVAASSAQEVIFTRNATEAINLVAQSWGRANLQPGDLVVLTEMEHHSNLVPWQMLCAEKDLRLEFIPVTDEGRLDLEAYARLLEQEPMLVAFAHISNVLGTINPAAKITKMAKKAGAIVLIDAAQSVPRIPVSVSDLGCDFMAFSGHKMCGPTGVGVLFGRKDLLEAMPPFLGGGDMIKRVGLREFVTNDLPAKFEAGTPAIGEVIGLGAAVEFLQGVGLDAVQAHEEALIRHALERLEEVPGVRVLGPHGEDRTGVASFTMQGTHPHDVAHILDSMGIAVRAGHHCAMPLHERYSLMATTRASFYLYNKVEEIDSLIEGLYKVKSLFG